MRINDLLVTAFHNLWIRKLRTALNLVGIVLSCVLLLCTLAATNGIRLAIQRFVENSAEARQFHVAPDYDRTVTPPKSEIAVVGEMSERRRERISKILEENWREKNQPKRYLIRNSTLDELRKFTGVIDVAPRYHFRCDVLSNHQVQLGVARSCSLYNSDLRNRMIAGQCLSQDSVDQVLLHEGIAYELGFRSDVELENLIGQTVEVHFKSKDNFYSIFGDEFFLNSVQKQAQWFRIIEHFLAGKSLSDLDPASQQLVRDFARSRQQRAQPQATQLIKKEFIVCGVFRRSDQQDVSNILSQYTGGYGDLLLHYSVLESLLPDSAKYDGAFNAVVYVNEFADLQPGVAKATELGLSAAAPTRSIERVFQAIERAQQTVFGIVAIVLFISAVGISNTMIISLIERTEEIGIMKAVGASNGNVLWIILFEGLVTGLLGGLIAILISLGVITMGNGILRSYVETRASMNLEGKVFAMQTWMVGLGIALSVTITTLAGLWPAWRAAKLDPVIAMGRG